MLSVSYAGKNLYSASKTSVHLRGDASGGKRCYALAHCATPLVKVSEIHIRTSKGHNKYVAGKLNPIRQLLKNSPIYPFFLGEAPELFVFVLVLSVSRYGGGF